MATATKARFPLLLLLGIIFLASVCVSYGIVQGNPCIEKCLQRYNKVHETFKHHECRSHCEKEEEEEVEEPLEPREPGRRERGRQEGEKEEKRRQLPPRTRDEDQDNDEWRGRRRHQDPEERARLRRRREEKERRQEHQREEEEETSSESQGRRNPFLFNSNKFQTIFENEHGHIRLLQRFDKRSNLFENLQNYRLLEYKARPHTLFLPQHTDADFILVVLSGKAILTVLNSNDRNSFNLECGDTIKLPAGTIAYLANRDSNEDLRIVDLAIPINTPAKFQAFFPFANNNQQSYFNGFSKNILEASFNAKYEDIERILLEEPQQRRGHRGRQQSQEAEVIVKVSREQIEELSKHAESSSRKSISSESEPFNLKSRSPIYSNKFGKFFEITPKKSSQLQDLDILADYAEINEGGLMLPHFNSRATMVVVVNEGKGNFELVGLRNEEEDEEEKSKQVQRYRANLSPGDVFVIPAGHPVAVNASSNLSLLGFGINAQNNERNFLAGEDDNVISQIERPVKELAFPGSAQEVDRLIKNQRQSHFANAQSQGSQRRSPLSSILDTFY